MPPARLIRLRPLPRPQLPGAHCVRSGPRKPNTVFVPTCAIRPPQAWTPLDSDERGRASPAVQRDSILSEYREFIKRTPVDDVDVRSAHQGLLSGHILRRARPMFTVCLTPSLSERPPALWIVNRRGSSSSSSARATA